MTNYNCPCGNKLNYIYCCSSIHKNIFKAQTAEQLMRSRYTAFTMANGEYLQLSHHSKTKPHKRELIDLIKWTKSVQWVKLEVIKCKYGGHNDKEGTVEFKAYYFLNGKLEYLQEKSSFLKENEHWVYYNAK